MSISNEEQQREDELEWLRTNSRYYREERERERREARAAERAAREAAKDDERQWINRGGYTTPPPMDSRTRALNQLNAAQIAEIQQGTATFDEISPGVYEYVPQPLTDAQLEQRIIEALPQNLKSEVLMGDLRLQKDRAEFDERAEPGMYDIKLTRQGLERVQQEAKLRREYDPRFTYGGILDRAKQLIPMYQRDTGMIAEAGTGYDVEDIRQRSIAERLATDEAITVSGAFRRIDEMPDFATEIDEFAQGRDVVEGIDKLQAELLEKGIRYDERIDRIQAAGLAHDLQRELLKRGVTLSPPAQRILNAKLNQERLKTGVGKGALKLFNVSLTAAGLITAGKAVGRVGEAMGRDARQTVSGYGYSRFGPVKKQNQTLANQKSNTQKELDAIRGSALLALEAVRADQKRKFADDPYMASGEIIGSVLTYTIPATAAAKASSSAARAAAIAGKATAKGTKLANKSRIIKRSGQAYEAIIEPGEALLTFAGKKIAPKTVKRLGGSLGPEELIIHGTVKTGAMLEKISVGSLNRVRRSVRAREIRRGVKTTFEAAPGTSRTEILNTWGGTIKKTADKPPEPVEITKWIDDPNFKSLEPAGIEAGTVGTIEAGDIFRRKVPITIKQEVPFPTTPAGKTPYTEELQPWFGGPTETRTGVGFVGDIKVTKNGKSKIVSARKAQQMETDLNVAKMINEARLDRDVAMKSRTSKDYMFAAADPVTPFARSGYKAVREADFPGIYKAEVKIKKAGKARTKPFPRTRLKPRADLDEDILSKMDSINNSISSKMADIEAKSLSNVGTNVRTRTRARARPDIRSKVRTRDRTRIRTRTRSRARARVRTRTRTRTRVRADVSARARTRTRTRVRARARTRIRAKWDGEEERKKIRDTWGGSGGVIRNEFELGLVKDLNAQAKIRKDALKDLAKMRAGAK